MKKLYIYMGPPCSGKSSAAKKYMEEVDSEVLIANRDTIRYTLGNGKYTMDYEDDVTTIELAQVRGAMGAGRTVIIDDTNLNPKYTKVWYDLAKEHGYEVEEKEFYVPYKEAMERSKKRKEEGGLYINKEIMQRFYKKYYKERFEKEMSDYRLFNMLQCENDLPSCVICDLDGTLVMHTGRTPFEWERLHEDEIDWRLSEILGILDENNVKVIFLTGRPESVREATETWLHDFWGGSYILIMRPENQFGKGNAVKKELYEQHIKGKYNVLCVFEDSNSCVEMWRNEGLLTLQVQNCDY